MPKIKLQNPLLVNEKVLKKYVDVYIHCENNSIVEGHMVILAQQSPFCHRFFQSRENMKVADMFFTNIRQSVIEKAVQIMYGKSIDVLDAELKRVTSFLTMLQVKYLLATPGQESVSQSSKQETQHEVDFPSSLGLTLDIKENAEPEHKEVQSVVKKAEMVLAINSTSKNQMVGFNFENWTETTEDKEKVDAIGHILVVNESLNRMQYQCKVCNLIFLAFRNAEKHFCYNHQDLEEEKKILANVQNGRDREKTKLEQYSKRSNTSFNKILVQHEMELIIENIENLVYKLDQLKDGLPTKLEFKKRDLMKKLANDKDHVKHYMDKINQ